MSRPTKITIAIITFHKDFMLLENLLSSIYKNWNPEEIDSIKLVLNDKKRYYTEFSALVEKNTHPNFKIDILYIDDLFPDLPEYVSLDWHSQQLFKCLVSNHISTDWYIIHDCKDFYTAPVELSFCFDEIGRATMHLDHTRYNHRYNHSSTSDNLSDGHWAHWGFGPFVAAYHVGCEIFGVDPSDYKNFHLPFVTPFFVKTQLMKEMLAELKSTSKGLFPYLFSVSLDGQQFLTEFMAYNAYCAAKNHLGDYVDWEYNHRKFFEATSHTMDGRLPSGARIQITSNKD